MTYPVLIQEIEDYLHTKRPDLKPDGAPFCQADLLFEADTAERLDADQDAVNHSLVSQEPQHWHVKDGYDGFHYLAQGMEPPTDTLAFWRGLYNALGWAAPIIFLVAFLAYCFLVKR